MSLIQKIRLAAEDGSINQPFTTNDLKSWIELAAVVKDDGCNYSESSINAILSNSDQANLPTTNKNIKILRSKQLHDGTKQYWFE